MLATANRINIEKVKGVGSIPAGIVILRFTVFRNRTRYRDKR